MRRVFIHAATFAAMFVMSGSAAGQRIDAEAYISANGTALEVSGQAQYFNSLGEPSAVLMGGDLTLWVKVLGSQMEQSTNYVWGTDSGIWSDFYNVSGSEGWCYQTTIEGRVVWMDGTSTVGAGSSSEYCVPIFPRTPPEPITLCDDGDGDGQCSPIVINFDAGSYRLSGTDAPVWFDINADGTPDRISWTAPGSSVAFLALDRDDNGVIDDGSELFGTSTLLRSGARAPNGFVALGELDSNADGIVNAQDEGWPVLLLWIDANHDGLSQPAELQGMTESPIHGLGTQHHWTGRRDSHGNLFGYQGTAYLSSGRRSIYDVYFRSVP